MAQPYYIAVCALALLLADGAVAIWPFSSGDGDSRFEHEGVVRLTQDTFESHVISGDDARFFFVKFYAPWCGHCKTLAPVWGQLAAENTDARIQFAQVDCSKNSRLCKKAAVRGFPEVKVFYKGQIGMSMTGGKDLEGMRQWVADAPQTVQERHQRAQQQAAEKAEAAAAKGAGGTADAGSAEL